MIPMRLAHVSWSSPFPLAPLKNPPAQEVFTQGGFGQAVGDRQAHPLQVPHLPPSRSTRRL